jgi:hypothetical protein
MVTGRAGRELWLVGSYLDSGTVSFVFSDALQNGGGVFGKMEGFFVLSLA